MEGATFVSAICMDSANQQFRDITRRYAERFGTDADSGVIDGYEAAQLLIKGLKQNDSPDMLKKTILGIRTFSSAAEDEIILDKFGDAVRAMYVMQIRNGKIRAADKLTPSEIGE